MNIRNGATSRKRRPHNWHGRPSWLTRRAEIGIKAGRQVQAAVRLVISATDLECSGTSSAGGAGAISAHLSLNRMASCMRTRNCSSL